VAGHDYINGDRWGIAPSITFGLKSATQATLSYYHMQSSELPDTGLPFNNPFSSGANVSKNGNGTPVNVPRDTFYGLVNRDFRDTQSDIGTIDVRHDFGNKLILRNVTRYGKTSNDYVWTQPDDSKGNTMLYGTVWRRANTRTTDTQALANATSLGGEFLAGGVKNTYTVGLEIGREETDRSSYLLVLAPTTRWKKSAPIARPMARPPCITARPCSTRTPTTHGSTRARCRRHAPILSPTRVRVRFRYDRVHAAMAAERGHPLG
jgi:outer membrane receptor for monomeric catechols